VASTSWSDAAGNDHSGELVDVYKDNTVVDCGHCGFKHLIPIPTADELSAAYETEYYAEEKPHYFDRHREDLDWWNLAYGDRYDVLETHLDPDRRRLLDIGSGPGFFLLHGQERGWDVRGIEPSRQAAEHARGLGVEVDNAFYSDETAPGLGTFDAINMAEVLEHIPDPADFLNLIHDHLSDDGVLCVVVPNDFNPFQAVLQESMGFEPWWITHHHLNYFDFESLGALFERCGFEVVMSEGTFPIDLFLLMDDNYIGNDEVGRASHGKRKTFEFNLAAGGRNDLKRDIYRKLAEVGLGREILIIGRKV
jgi:SAM-dependent methyltransferase